MYCIPTFFFFFFSGEGCTVASVLIVSVFTSDETDALLCLFLESPLSTELEGAIGVIVSGVSPI